MKYSVVFVVATLFEGWIASGSDLVEHSDAELKVSNGEKATYGRFGYNVRLVINENLQCGGSIINSKWILTAAHCLFPAVPFMIKGQIGFLNTKDNSSGEGYWVTMERYIIHELFNRATFWNDIALIRVKEIIRLDGNNSFPIQLPEQTENPIEYNGSAIATGWGRLQEKGELADDLMWATIDFVSNSNCSVQYPGLFNPKLMVCAGGQGNDTCQGDSGGPLALVNFLIGKNAPVEVGIVSTGKACGSKDATIYTRVSTYVDWIRKHTNDTGSGWGSGGGGGGIKFPRMKRMH